MKLSLRPLLAACAFGLFSLAASAQVPADAPPGTTVQCKDDTYASPDSKSGACRGHKGIKTWYGKTAAAAAPATPAAAAPAAAPAAKAPAKTDAAPTAAAPGGGAGKVWANTSTNVYHCMGDKFYGKTKKGEYMSEADAKSKGMHASHNKACS